MVDLELVEVLNTIFDPLAFSYYVIDNDIIVLLKNGDSSIRYTKKSSIESNVIAIGEVKVGLTKAKLYGNIYSGETEEPLPTTFIYSSDNAFSTTSTVDGFYSLELPVGINNLIFQSTGFTDMEFQIQLNSDGQFDLNMYEDITKLDEVTISAKIKNENVSGTITGEAKLSVQEIKKIPAMFGEADLIRSVLTMPGITTVGEGVGGFNVRGSSVGQNLVLLDGGTIYNPSHLFGFFSAVSSDAIGGLQLYRGTIPAEFGGRIASAMDIELKRGNKEKVTGSGGVNIVSSRFNIEIPVKKDTSSLSLGMRLAYPTLLIRRVDDLNLQQSNAFFGDLSLKYDHKINEKNVLSLSGYHSDDRLTLADQAEYAYANTIGTVKWVNVIKENLTGETLLNYSGYQYALTDRASPNEAYASASSIQDFKVENNLTFSGIRNHSINIGTFVIHHALSPGDFEPVGESILQPVTLVQESAQEFGVYASDQFQLSDQISLYGGMRFYVFNGGKESFKTQYYGLDPRLSINYRLNALSSIKLGYNKTRQFIHLISNTVAVTPVDAWKLSNSQIKPTVADQISLGYFRNDENNEYEFSAEAYYKNIKNLIEYRNGAQLSLNPEIENELIQGKGMAYGLELSLKKNLGKVNGSLNYTFSRSLIQIDPSNSREKINNGNFYPTNFDQPHNINMLTNIELSRRFSLSTNFVYSSGRPITRPQTTYDLFGISVADYTDRNNYRIPDYHRLDVTLFMSSSLKKMKKVEANWSLTIYNLYARDNVYSVFFRRNSAAENIEAFQFIVIGRPLVSLAYNFKF